MNRGPLADLNQRCCAVSIAVDSISPVIAYVYVNVLLVNNIKDNLMMRRNLHSRYEQQYMGKNKVN